MISVIIPNYNGIEHLKQCFDSLRRQTLREFSVIMIDNNSSDDSVKFVSENYSEVKIIRMSSNTGFAKAVNQGIKIAMLDEKTDYIVLLNNDTECDANFLSEMKKGFRDSSTGSVACKMLNFNERNKIDDAGDFIKSKGSPYARGYEETDTGQYDKGEFIFGACAGASAYRKEVFRRAGFFDEDFFAYYEDVDFSFRLQLCGYKCFYNPDAVVYHKRGATTSNRLGFQTMLCERNLVALRIKNYPLSILILNLPVFMLVRIKRYFLFLTKHSSSLFFSALKGYCQGVLKIPKSIGKRREIQRLKTVGNDYIKSILR